MQGNLSHGLDSVPHGQSALHPGGGVVRLHHVGSRQVAARVHNLSSVAPSAVYFWKDASSVQINPEVSLAEFYVVGYRQRRVLESLSSGNYSRLCMDIMVTRSMGYYLIQVLPSDSHLELPSATYTTCPWPGVRAQQPDRGDVLGELLPGPQLGPRQDRAGRHHRAHHGHPHELRQQVPRADVDDLYNDSSNLHLPQLSAKDLVHEVPGCVSRGVLPPGVRRPPGVRHGQLQRQEDQTQHAAVGGDTAPAAGGPGQVVELQTNPRVI